MIVPSSVTCATVADNLSISGQTFQTVKMPAQTVLRWIHTLFPHLGECGVFRDGGVGHTELRGMRYEGLERLMIPFQKRLVKRKLENRDQKKADRLCGSRGRRSCVCIQMAG